MKTRSTKDCASNRVNAVIYAPSGFGKTFLAGTLQGRTLIVSAESGLLSLHNKDIDFIELDSENKLEQLQDICRKLKDGVEYDNIFIDSLTEIAELFIEDAEKQFPDARNSLQKWGLYGKKLRSFIKFTRDLSAYNVFFTCLMKTDKDEVGKRWNLPDLSGSIASKLPQFFDCVFTIRIFQKDDEEKRVLMTHASEGYVCKDRSGLLKDYEEMNLGIILDKLRSENV